MKKSMLFSVVCFSILLSGCSYFSFGGGGNPCVERLADRHEQKLKQYFTSGNKGNTDVSTLISETRMISQKLKAAGMKERANKFDSYIDVLTYGNKTIDESIKDVENLVRNKEGSNEGDSKVCRFLNSVFP